MCVGLWRSHKACTKWDLAQKCEVRCCPDADGWVHCVGLPAPRHFFYTSLPYTTACVESAVPLRRLRPGEPRCSCERARQLQRAPVGCALENRSSVPSVSLRQRLARAPMADVLATEATCSSSLVSESADTGGLRATLVNVLLAGRSRRLACFVCAFHTAQRV